MTAEYRMSFAQWAEMPMGEQAHREALYEARLLDERDAAMRMHEDAFGQEMSRMVEAESRRR